MTNTLIQLTEDEFDARFPLVTNHLNPHASWAFDDYRGCLFETFGEDLTFVQQQQPQTIWTLVDGEDGDLYLISGCHFVNRIGYLVSTVPVPEGSDIQVHIPMDAAETTQPDVMEPSLANVPPDDREIHALLASRHEVAVIWSVEDVLELRPDLDEEQAWKVLQQCSHVHDCEVGFNWHLIEYVANDLFPEPSR